MNMKKVAILPMITGMIFAFGLALGGMTRADVVLGFLDVTGDWNPSLLFVMAGAVLFNLVTFRVILKRPNPFWRPDFQVPTDRRIDMRLILGAAAFGIGWGLAGICPGPGLVTVTSMSQPALVFVFGMTAGMWLFRLWDAKRARD